jgi:hypothetical protein
MLKEQEKKVFIKLSVNETSNRKSFFIGLACYKNAELKKTSGSRQVSKQIVTL